MKRLLFQIFDIITAPFAVISALHLRTFRRYGAINFPLTRKVLLAVGIYPVWRHYYDPLFHPQDIGPHHHKPRPLPGLDLNDSGQLQLLDQFHYNDEIARFASETKPVVVGDHTFRIDNGMFTRGDVDFYYNMIRNFKPARIVEIGSGNSTVVALHAIENNQKGHPAYTCDLTAVEPYPWFRHPKLTLLDKKVEDVPESLFTSLGRNDILFIDSSHMIRPGGDVVIEFLQILPKIAPGVIVHVHDVFTPYDYPASWFKDYQSFWNEQYLLEAFLTLNPDFEIIGALNYLNNQHKAALHAKCPLLIGHDINPQSFWMRRK